MSGSDTGNGETGDPDRHRVVSSWTFSLGGHLPPEGPADVSSRHEEVRQSVSALHSFVDLVDRARSKRLRGLGVLVALNVGDVVTTAGFLARGGSEGNPVLAPIVERWWLVVLIKAIILAEVSFRVLDAPPRSASAQRFVGAACVFYLMVVAWNIVVLLRLQ